MATIGFFGHYGVCISKKPSSKYAITLHLYSMKLTISWLLVSIWFEISLQSQLTLVYILAKIQGVYIFSILNAVYE